MKIHFLLSTCAHMTKYNYTTGMYIYFSRFTDWKMKKAIDVYFVYLYFVCLLYKTTPSLESATEKLLS